MNISVGTCGICGGRVSTPMAWMSVSPAPVKCESCGAEPINQYGPTMPMKPQRKQQRQKELSPNDDDTPTVVD